MFMNDNPVYSVFAEFTERCLEEMHSPYFRRGKLGAIDRFFLGIKQSHPKGFEDYLFDTRMSFPFCKKLDEDFQSLALTGLLYSIAPDFNPHIFSKIMAKFCDKEFREFGQMFYDKFSCNQQGILYRHTEFTNVEQII